MPSTDNPWGPYWTRQVDTWNPLCCVTCGGVQSWRLCVLGLLVAQKLAMAVTGAACARAQVLGLQDASLQSLAPCDGAD